MSRVSARRRSAGALLTGTVVAGALLGGALLPAPMALAARARPRDASAPTRQSSQAAVLVSHELEPVQRPTSSGEWVASVIYPTAVRRAPSFTAERLGMVPAVTPWGTPDELLVLGKRTNSEGHTWLRVRLDVRPNGSAVWLDGQDVTVHRDSWRILVSRKRRRLTVYRDGRVAKVFRVVVGKRSTPTPVGLFAIAAELRQPDPKAFVGAWVLPLTAHSRVLRRFDGGDGQIALHGRGGASLLDPLGTARSHGCIRLANATVGWIATHVPVGTPVRVW